MRKDLTEGPVMRSILMFTWPMLAGNLLQQCYNMVDTLVVGKALGSGALAAVGSAFTLMTFLTSILIGLCMGAGAVCSIYFGRRDEEGMKERMAAAAVLIGAAAVVLQLISGAALRGILTIMRTPEEIYGMTERYMRIILWGIFFVFLYNYFSYILRAVGNSLIPLIFLGLGTVCNIALDLLFVMVFRWGVEGAALATILAQGLSGVGIMAYSLMKEPVFRLSRNHFGFPGRVMREVTQNAFAACIQQSIMNFGILMIQGLVNSFGTAVMAAFAVGVKIDSFAYMPVQEFGNAFSVFVAQNHGAGKSERIQNGVSGAVKMVIGFSLAVSVLVLFFAPNLIRLFVNGSEREVIAIGAGYLRIEGAFYWGIGLLFLLYGYFRAVELPMMSVVLTVISLGTRVALSYLLAPGLGWNVIWCSIPIGWILADATGYLVYRRRQRGAAQRNVPNV